MFRVLAENALLSHPSALVQVQETGHFRILCVTFTVLLGLQGLELERLGFICCVSAFSY